mmetsp:Transcript_89/g.154  ORF Transcript_89/g.154 Transcript_89/m.154 type:complete len:651 (+) Transcript_89:37-1989(+)
MTGCDPTAPNGNGSTLLWPVSLFGAWCCLNEGNGRRRSSEAQFHDVVPVEHFIGPDLLKPIAIINPERTDCFTEPPKEVTAHFDLMPADASGQTDRFQVKTPISTPVHKTSAREMPLQLDLKSDNNFFEEDSPADGGVHFDTTREMAQGPPTSTSSSRGQWGRVSPLARAAASSRSIASRPTMSWVRIASTKSRCGADLVTRGVDEWWNLAQRSSGTGLMLRVSENSELDRPSEGWWGSIPEFGEASYDFTLTRGMFHPVRHYAAQGRLRYRKDGFDLDLAYVTSRIIAMSFPGKGLGRTFRNKFAHVNKFLNTKHPGHFRIYNLCGEPKLKDNGFTEQTIKFGCPDHSPPPMQLLWNLCQDAESWLRADPENVVVIHCKAGKGRTGVVVCAFLLYVGAARTAYEALKWWAQVRGGKYEGVTIPSQIRWVCMWHHWLLNGAKGLNSDPMDLDALAPPPATVPVSPMYQQFSSNQLGGGSFGKYRLREAIIGPVCPDILREDAAGKREVEVSIKLVTHENLYMGTGTYHKFPKFVAFADKDDVVIVELPSTSPILDLPELCAVIVLSRPGFQCGPGPPPGLKMIAWWNHAFLCPSVNSSLNGGQVQQRLLLDLPPKFIDGKTIRSKDHPDTACKLRFEDLRTGDDVLPLEN